jgi:hypothetical protein
MSDWKYRGIVRRDFRNGGVEIEDFEDPRIQKPTGGYKSQRKACKKSKDGLQCEFSEKKVIGTRWTIDSEAGTRVPSLHIIAVCRRCGKYSWAGRWSSYIYTTLQF